MINRLPADVPKTGERYDLTLTSAGLDSRKRELVALVIDNGPHKGVRVSAYLDTATKSALIEFGGVSDQEFSVAALDKRKYEVRLSAQIDVERLSKNGHGQYTPVTEDYKATNVYVHYNLSSYGDAAEPSGLAAAFKRKEGKFTRKPAAKPRRKAKPQSPQS